MTIRLTAIDYDFWVDVRIRSYGNHWIAVADVAGEPELGLGLNARQAMERALAPLGRSAVEAFLSDPALVNASSWGACPQQPPTD